MSECQQGPGHTHTNGHGHEHDEEDDEYSELVVGLTEDLLVGIFEGEADDAIMVFTPAEARELADALRSVADEAEEEAGEEPASA